MYFKDQKDPKDEFVSILKFEGLDWFYDIFLTLSGFGRGFKKRITHLAKMETPPHTIADIGCGTGTQLEIIKSTYPEAHTLGIDPDPKLLNKIKTKFASEKSSPVLIQALAESIPLEDNSIDLCYSTLTFHHMSSKSKRASFKEIYRILKPSGVFLLTDWGPIRFQIMRWLLLWEKQEYMDDHFKGLMPVYAQEAGFVLTETTRKKPSAIRTWRFVKTTEETGQ